MGEDVQTGGQLTHDIGVVAGDELRKLQLVTDAALAHLALPELLDALLERVREILDADTCAVLLLDEHTNELVARAAKGLEEEVEQGVRIPVGRGFAGRIAAERRAIVIDDVDHADVLNPLLRQKGIRSLLGVPLLIGGEVLGVIHVGALVKRSFTEDERRLLQLAADRVALAIDHGRLFEAERSLARRLRKLQSVTDAALSPLPLTALLDELLERMRDMLDADTCAVLLLDERTNELVARAAKGLEEEVEQGVRIPVGRGFAGRIASERTPIVLDIVDHSTVLNPILWQKGIRSLLGAPLVVRDRVLGVIHVGTLVPRRFTKDDVELLSLAAERAAMALERALVGEELIRLDRVRQQFVSVASHELRTPATAILGAAETLESRWETLPAQTADQLRRIILEQSRRLVLLLEQLLDLSRLESRAITVRPERINVRERAEHVAAVVGVEQREEVAVRIPPELEVDADEAAFDRIVSNLLVNALRHGAPPITISAMTGDCHLHLVVEDRGPGVPPDFQGRMFDEFTRSADAAPVPGTGLGLAIAKSYARASGGDLLYEDAEPRGARFRLVLPIAAAASG